MSDGWQPWQGIGVKKKDDNFWLLIERTPQDCTLKEPVARLVARGRQRTAVATHRVSMWAERTRYGRARGADASAGGRTDIRAMISAAGAEQRALRLQLHAEEYRYHPDDAPVFICC